MFFFSVIGAIQMRYDDDDDDYTHSVTELLVQKPKMLLVWSPALAYA